MLEKCENRTAQISDVDWETATVREIVIDDNEFTPALVHFHPRSPSVIRLVNKDDRSHALKARKFFRSVQVVAVGDGNPAPLDACMTAVAVPALGTLDVRVVTGEPDSYDYETDFLMTYTIPVGVHHGVISVQ